MVSLPGVAAFRCDLLVRSVQAAGGAHRDAAGSARTVRVGCAFEALSQPMQRVLQRFVFDTDKSHLQRVRGADARRVIGAA